MPPGAAKGLGEAVASGGAQQAIAIVPPSARGVVEEAATRAFLDGFNAIIVVAAIIAFAGAVLSLLLIRDRDLVAPRPACLSRRPPKRGLLIMRAQPAEPALHRERNQLPHSVTFIPGDGTGPELAEATRRVLEATGVEFEWDFQDAGIDVYEEEGNPLPDRTLDSIRERGIAIKGPTTTPVGSGHRSINVALRKEFDLYACIRPCKAYEGVRTRFPETDLVIVRENTEDLYAGIEFEKGSDEVERLRKFLAEELDSPTRDESGISIKPISVFGSERIVEAAFTYAKENGRKKVTAAHKANIMKFSDGLFLEVARQVAERHPEIEFEDRIIDNLCNQLVSRPEEYDVIVLPNLYGDIVSDLCAGMIGGLGLASGANIGTSGAIFEATHGSAPKYKGQNRVNPTALLLSGVLMLRHLNETEAADRMEGAIAEVIRKGDKVTYDLKPSRDDPTAVGTSEYADAVIEEMQNQ